MLWTTRERRFQRQIRERSPLFPHRPSLQARTDRQHVPAVLGFTPLASYFRPVAPRYPELTFRIDKLTRSIENVITGERFPTLVLPLAQEDLRTVTKKNGWLFNWRSEFRAVERKVFKLTTADNPHVVQGLVCLEVKPDHVFMELVESAPHNLGRNKVYDGVLGNLVAYLCKVSFEEGFDGHVAFLAKTKLIQHYTDKLHAVHVGGHLMIIYPPAARYPVDRYFPR